MKSTTDNSVLFSYFAATYGSYDHGSQHIFEIERIGRRRHYYYAKKEKSEGKLNERELII